LDVTKVKQDFVTSSHLTLAQAALKGLEDYVAALNDEYIDVEAWSVFHVWLDGRPEKNAPYFSAFRAWQLFHWRPATGTIPLPIDDQCKTIAEAYLKLKAERLDTKYIDVLKKGVKYSPDIYEVCMFDGDLVTAIGSISGKKITIYQPGLSRMGKSGDYLMAHAIPVSDDCSILLGASDFISRKAKPLVRKFCELAQRCDNSSPGAFEDLQSDFFNLFYDLINYSTKSK
jgi:hypothetical protein